MNTKKYRATTMREALEQVRQELGDDALVLDTKKVRAGGILGLGGRDLVEVRVAADGISENQSAAEPQSTKATASRSTLNTSLLNLRDDSPAAPSSNDIRPAVFPAAYTALTARAGVEPLKTSAHISSEDDYKPTAPRQTVELAETAPRVVHRPAALTSALVTTASSSESASPALQITAPTAPEQIASPAANAPRNNQPSELERLHAELREMKFTLGRLTARSLAADSPLSLRTQHYAASAEVDAQLYDSPYYEAFMELTAAGLTPDVARGVVRSAMNEIAVAEDADPIEFAAQALVHTLETSLHFADESFVASLAAEAGAARIGSNTPLVFVGPTGVGKTTTIAKLAAHIALRQRRRVELITMDTYRIAAVEQLKTYAEIIGAGCHVASSVVELNALANRFAKDAVVLVDTTGRSPNDLADQLELADYLRASDDFLKCLVLPATTHPADAAVAVRKFALYGANRLVLTKLDETSRPGAAVEVALDAQLPLLYFCAGQRVPEDLEKASATSFARRVLRRS